MIRVYLDACCLNRPFDDQTQVRIRLEAEAVLMILAQCESGDWEWIGSDALAWEIERIPDMERLRRVKSLCAHAQRSVPISLSEIERAQELETWGIEAYDALHLACAESGGADIVLTTDDRLLHRSAARASELCVRVANPLTWLREVERDMNSATMTLEQVRLTGLQALSRDLGPVGLVRFLQQFETGHGDYTTDRHGWLSDRTVQDVVDEMEGEPGLAAP